MKVLFDHPTAFFLAHGGFQIQIEQTKRALEASGLDVEYVRWWDDRQRGDVIHFFGRPSVPYLNYAHGKGMKVVVSELLSELGSRSAAQRRLQKTVIRIAQTLLPKAFTVRMAWDTFALADACVALTPWEANLLVQVFAARPETVHVIANGVEKEFFESQPVARGKWLICTATVTERKRVLETAEAAVLAATPLWVVGRPYSEESEYARKFCALQQRHPDVIRYEGPIADRSELARAYRQARGFVLLSAIESLSLSALEAATCECPLLLSDLPWARTSFGENASYCSVSAKAEKCARALRAFYESAPNLSPPPRPKTWNEIAGQLRTMYTSLLTSNDQSG